MAENTSNVRELVPVAEQPVQLATLPVQAVVSRMERIQQIKDKVMVGPELDSRGKVVKHGVHFTIIPGCKKPSLLQPGAEILLTTFRLGARHTIEDLSVPGVVRYRVRCEVYDQTTGVVIGDEWGECSSDEEKYAWRRAVCDEEYEATDAALRRLKWSEGYQGAPAKSTRQVKTNPADVANTVLAMASKRAKVRAARAALAASDTFDINLEDLPPEMREAASEDHVPTEEQVQRARETSQRVNQRDAERRTGARPPQQRTWQDVMGAMVDAGLTEPGTDGRPKPTSRGFKLLSEAGCPKKWSEWTQEHIAAALSAIDAYQQPNDTPAQGEVPTTAGATEPDADELPGDIIDPFADQA